LRYLIDAGSLAALGFVLGLVGGGGHTPVGVLLTAALLLGVFNAFYQLARAHGLIRGLIFGGMLGGLVGIAGMIVWRPVVDLASGAAYGLALGFCLGALVGFISRVKYEKNDALSTRLFLFVGSIFLGASLGAGVGLMAGVFLGIIGYRPWGLVFALLAGTVVCAYLGSYFQSVRAVVLGSLLGLGLTAVALLIGGSFAGFVFGSFAGAAAPMLLVAAIGAVGGLLGRGPKAMILEAVEAPGDMLQQGAVPFLLPAMITGAAVGAMASGPGGLMLIVAALALLGMGFGEMRDLDGRPGANITMRTLVETAMMGADEWPLRRMMGVVMGENKQAALRAALAGMILGCAGAVFGLFLFGLVSG